MSRLIPPQFDSYGTTFWIPSQVEPAVALVGTSLPAIRQSITVSEGFTKLWSSWLPKSGSSRTSSGAGEKALKLIPSSNKSPNENFEI